MQPASNRRFDTNWNLQTLLEIGHEQSLDKLVERAVARGIEHPKVDSLQVWLLGKGDQCDTCAHRDDCRDRTKCLHLLGCRSKTMQRGILTSFFGEPMPERLPLAKCSLEEITSKRQPLLLGEMTPMDPLWQKLLEEPWVQKERICSVAITPIIYQQELLGVIVIFSRQALPGNSKPWGQVFADHIGAAIANARAFEEIQRLKAQLELQNSYLQEEVVEAKAFGDLVGHSAALRHLISQIDLVAPTEASVLILGETGTGKELVAHEIHRRSARKDAPLVRVNCASIPRDLFESEFFGHARGAFTGAHSDRAGRFETADGGTLFLDEVGEIPLEMQSKLLRVLQEKKYERLGEDRTRSTDVRVIGATNRDLMKAVAAGRFREDLYYRLHVFPIQVVPLRLHKDDIPLLAQHFIDLSVKELKCTRPRLTKAAITKLQAYNWPGNVRELRNVIERSVILAQGGPLNFDLPVTDSAPSIPAPPSTSRSVPPTAAAPDYYTETEMQQRERDNLIAVLKRANGKIKGKDGAAERLGIKPATLFARLRKLRLAPV